MYKIIGADEQEYGPVTTEQIREWISEGRVNAQTRACLEGTQDWKPLGMFPEFGLGASPGAGSPPPLDTGPMSMEEILARDYSLDILSCLSRGWELFKREASTVFLTFLLLIGLGLASGVAMQIILMIAGAKELPFATQQYMNQAINLFVSALVTGPAAAGLYYVYLRLIRGQPTNPGDLFNGFKSAYSDLFLGRLITALVAIVCTIPSVISFVHRLGPIMDQIKINPKAFTPQEMLSQMLSGFLGNLPIVLVCMIPAFYFLVNWQFVLPLIIDKEMGFWPAIKTSWKMVHKHWFHLFGLLVLLSVLNVAGFLCCLVGLLLTVPLSMAATMYAYEDIFGRKA